MRTQPLLLHPGLTAREGSADPLPLRPLPLDRSCPLTTVPALPHVPLSAPSLPAQRLVGAGGGGWVGPRASRTAWRSPSTHRACRLRRWVCCACYQVPPFIPDTALRCNATVVHIRQCVRTSPYETRQDGFTMAQECILDRSTLF